MADQQLKAQITDAMKDAMRAKDKRRLGVIRLMLAEIKRVEVDERIEVADERVIAILDKMVKQRRDSESQFESAGRQDLAEQEAFEIGVIQEFLPAALSGDEIEVLINEAIHSAEASSMKEMGKVMGILKPKLQGRADMGEVSKIIKAKLAG